MCICAVLPAGQSISLILEAWKNICSYPAVRCGGGWYQPAISAGKNNWYQMYLYTDSVFYAVGAASTLCVKTGLLTYEEKENRWRHEKMRKHQKNNISWLWTAFVRWMYRTVRIGCLHSVWMSASCCVRLLYGILFCLPCWEISSASPALSWSASLSGGCLLSLFYFWTAISTGKPADRVSACVCSA